MNIDIICPLYNAEQYILPLYDSLKKQKNVEIHKILFLLTDSTDRSEEILKENHIDYTKIKREDFSHSKTREDAAMQSSASFLVFITQDIDIRNADWLEKLVEPLKTGEAEASFSRQITKYKNIEKYTREKNYPTTSYINSKEDIEKKGLNTFFFSDASSAIKTEVFKELGGYDGKVLPTNEDMYIAHKIITHGYRIKYCADSVVYHSHKLTLKQLYSRYFLVGRFMAQNQNLDEYGTNKSGEKLAWYVLKRALKEFNVKVLFRFIPDMFARWRGMRKGKKYELKQMKKMQTDSENTEK